MKQTAIVFSSLFILTLSFPVVVSAVAPPSKCDADINQDSVVDLIDYSSLTSDFFLSDSLNKRTDINLDKFVDINDYSVVVQHFFSQCNQYQYGISPTVTSGSIEIEAENFDYGKEEEAYHDSDVQNTGGEYRSERVDIKGLGSERHAIGWMASGEWLEYTINVPAAGWYKLALSASTSISSPQPVASVALMDAESEIGSPVVITINNTGDYANFQPSQSAQALQLQAGENVLRLTVTQQWFDLDKLTLISVAAPAPDVVINPGQDVQSIVNANPAGSTYLLKAGEYRMQQIIPKTGDTYIGEKGALLTGARLLTSFQQEGNLWYASGQTQQGQVHGECNIQGLAPRCMYPEDFFINDLPLLHVASKAQVTTGKYFFDYDSDRIYFADNPSGKKVETSVSRRAFGGHPNGGSASNVTIKNFIIEKYAVPAQMGAIGDQYPGDGWMIENNEVRWNHGTGINVGSEGVALRNYIHHQGQKGIGSNGTNTRMEENEIAYNHWAGFNIGWEAGGNKSANTTGLIVRGNYSHHNEGPGFWTDIDNIDTLYENNIVTYNSRQGITSEINFKATIRNNFSAYNGFGDTAWLWGSQILVQNSSDHEVYGNTVIADQGDGLGIITQDRGYSMKFPIGQCDKTSEATRKATCRPWTSFDNSVHDNTVYMLTSSHDAAALVSDRTYAPYDPASIIPRNSFSGNTYYVPDVTRALWGWPNASRTWAAWQGFGQDTTGSVHQIVIPAQLPVIPTFSVPVGPQ